MAAPLTVFSAEFNVSLRSMISSRRHGCLHTAHTRTPITIGERKAMAVQGRKEGDLVCSGAAEIVIELSEQWSMGATKRYPRPSKVSTYFGSSAESPSALLSLFTAALRL